MVFYIIFVSVCFSWNCFFRCLTLQILPGISLAWSAVLMELFETDLRSGGFSTSIWETRDLTDRDCKSTVRASTESFWDFISENSVMDRLRLSLGWSVKVRLVISDSVWELKIFLLYPLSANIFVGIENVKIRTKF